MNKTTKRKISKGEEIMNFIYLGVPIVAIITYIIKL